MGGCVIHNAVYETTPSFNSRKLKPRPHAMPSWRESDPGQGSERAEAEAKYQEKLAELEGEREGSRDGDDDVHVAR